MKKIGSIIKKQRNIKNVSQEKLAELLGVKRPTISQIENNERKVTVEELLKLS
jgi:transcriptional regulator with XRE-family HTH domain